MADDKRFLVMSHKWKDSTTKTIEPTENKADRIEFNPPHIFREGKARFPGAGVLAKMKELSFDETEAGREKPGFAIVNKVQLEQCRTARDVKVIADIAALNKGLVKTRAVEVEEEEDPLAGIPAMPEEVEEAEDEKYDCEFCRRKGFSRKTYPKHLSGFHLRFLQKKTELDSDETELMAAIQERIKELS